MYPTPERPASGPFVRDQVEALQRRGDVEVELFHFAAGTRNYPRAARELRRRYEPGEFDVVHVHFGLVAWPALLAGLRPLVVTLHGNDLLHPRPRPEARQRLGLDPDGPYLLFPHDPSRPLKRFDRAQEAAGDVPLLTLGGVPA